MLPITPGDGWDVAKAFTESALPREWRRRHPIVTSRRSPRSARHGRILIDYLRNDRGSTAVGAYSTRGFAQATVSTPLAWDELSERIRSDHFTVGNLRNRLQFLERDPWDGFFKLRQRLPKKGW